MDVMNDNLPRSERPLTTGEIKTIVDDLLNIGVFRIDTAFASCDRDEAMDMIDALCGEGLQDDGNGWFAYPADKTLVVDVLSRIAAVTEDRVIPYEDIAIAIMQMVKFGPRSEAAIFRRTIADRWNTYFDVLPSVAIITVVAEYLGATASYKGIDFSTVEDVINPLNDTEEELLDLLLMQADCAAPTSRLCRMMTSRPSRTQLDFTILKSIPFIIKKNRQPARLIGYKPDEALHAKDDIERLRNVRRSSDQSRILIEYEVSYEGVEGNSFNVPPGCREEIAGRYIEAASGLPIDLDLTKKDKRKLTGIGKIIRTIAPDYSEGQVVYVLLDKVARTARVEVGHKDDMERLEGITDALEGRLVPAGSEDEPQSNQAQSGF